MKITQISVFLENKRGRLLEVCSLLGEHDINIRALNVAESEGFGVLRIVVDKPDEAVKVLKAQQFIASLTDIVAVEVEDKPGGLARVLAILATHKLNIEYMYAFLERSSDKALLVFRFDDSEKAQQALMENGIRVMSSSDVKNL